MVFNMDSALQIRNVATPRQAKLEGPTTIPIPRSPGVCAVCHHILTRPVAQHRCWAHSKSL